MFDHRSVRLVACAVSATLALAGCATASKDISSSYVSPAQYQSYDCKQLDAEAQRLQARYLELGGRLDQAASNDKAIVGVGMILFWPALFALGGTKQQELEFGRLKGEHEAVEMARVEKKCGAASATQTVAPAAPAASAAI